jgi:hypothetical protein
MPNSISTASLCATSLRQTFGSGSILHAATQRALRSGKFSEIHRVRKRYLQFEYACTARIRALRRAVLNFKFDALLRQHP